MTLPTAPTLTIDQVFTRHAYNKVGGADYKDSRYKKRPLLKLLRERKVSAPGGGQRIVHPVNLGTSFNGRSLARNETFEFNGNSNETWSVWTWSVIIETCFVSWWDIREAAGNKFKMISILDSRLNETRENIEENIATQLSQSSAADTDDLNPILSIVATTGASGGLNPATSGQSAWAAVNEDTINWSVEGIGRTREAIQVVEDNKGMTDVILLPDQFYNETCEIGDAALVINQDAKTRGGTKYADLGLKVPFILNTPVIHDSAWNTAQTATGVGLDLDDIHLVVDPQWDMYVWPFKEMVYQGRLGQGTVQIEVAQLTCSRRRTQFSLTTVS
jgi:hypothetical protein